MILPKRGAVGEPLGRFGAQRCRNEPCRPRLMTQTPCRGTIPTGPALRLQLRAQRSSGAELSWRPRLRSFERTTPTSPSTCARAARTGAKVSEACYSAVTVGNPIDSRR